MIWRKYNDLEKVSVSLIGSKYQWLRLKTFTEKSKYVASNDKVIQLIFNQK